MSARRGQLTAMAHSPARRGATVSVSARCRWLLLWYRDFASRLRCHWMLCSPQPRRRCRRLYGAQEHGLNFRLLSTPLCFSDGVAVLQPVLVRAAVVSSVLVT